MLLFADRPLCRLYVGATQSSYNAPRDIIVAISPKIIITKLSTSRKMKIGLCVDGWRHLVGSHPDSFANGLALLLTHNSAAAATIAKFYLIKGLDKHAEII